MKPQPIETAPKDEEEDESLSQCPYCRYDNISDDWVYVCQVCGKETCPDCAGRCGCDKEYPLATNATSTTGL